MVDDDSPEFLDGKDEAARRRVARRVGESLAIDGLPDAQRLAGEALARELVGDAIESVRRELAFAVRNAPSLPMDIALRLAHDVDSVAVPFLEATEVFSDQEWRDLVRTISIAAQVTVAQRHDVTEGIALTLATIGEAAVVTALIENPDAPLSEQTCTVVVDRFADETAVLDALAQRDDIGIRIVLDLIEKVSDAMRAKLERVYGAASQDVADETAIAALISMLRKTSDQEISTAVKALGDSGRLTPGLLLKSLGDDLLVFFQHAIAFLSRTPSDAEDPPDLPEERSGAFGVFGTAGIPKALHQAMWDALEEALARRDWETSYRS